MKAPISWLRDLVQLPESATTDEIAARYTAAGLVVERIETTGPDFSGPVVVGRVLEFTPEQQKNGKTIRWCRVDVGEQLNAEGLERNVDPEHPGRGIVCGADNFAVGDLVVVSLPGAVLAGGFEIASRKTYGHYSDGMICAEDELGLGSDHGGIIVVDPASGAEPGMAAEDFLGQADVVLELDVTPDIGYCLALRGLAREAAQAFDVPYIDPYLATLKVPSAAGHPVVIEDDRCSWFTAVTIEGADPTAPTPDWMRARLEASGMRSISVLVDITNYVMLKSGQPLHAYDADTLTGPIRVRSAVAGEQLVTLDDVGRELAADDLVIADDSGAIGLAGVMGGLATEVTDQTRTIVLEAAHFDPATIGASHRHHKLPSEASKRFERGVDSALALAAGLEAAGLMVELAGGQITGVSQAGGPGVGARQVIAVDLPARILGTELDVAEIEQIFAGSGIGHTRVGESFELQAPTWRPDLVDPFDYVEEVLRKVGFDRIDPQLMRAPAGYGLTTEQTNRRLVTRAVVAAGFTEQISLPFLGREEITQLGVQPDDARLSLVKLANPLDDTRPFLRSTLLPGLFASVVRNTSRSNDDLAVFETGRVFGNTGTGQAPRPDLSDRPSDQELAALEAALPSQPRMLAGVVAGNWLPVGWQGPAVKADWTHVVGLAQAAAEALGLALGRTQADLAPWHPGRCAALTMPDGTVIGYAGELHPSVISQFGLPARACAVELDLDALVAAAPPAGTITELSHFPVAKEDVALIVDETVSAAEVAQALREGAGDLLESVTLFDVYRSEQVGAGKKSLAFALRLRADRTLTDGEAAQVRGAAVAVAAERFGAIHRA